MANSGWHDQQLGVILDDRSLAGEVENLAYHIAVFRYYRGAEVNDRLLLLWHALSWVMGTPPLRASN